MSGVSCMSVLASLPPFSHRTFSTVPGACVRAVLTLYSSEPCMRGHRSSKCTHSDRILVQVRKPGRPLSSCPHPSGQCNCGGVRMAIPKGGQSLSSSFTQQLTGDSQLRVAHVVPMLRARQLRHRPSAVIMTSRHPIRHCLPGYLFPQPCHLAESRSLARGDPV